MNLFKLWVALVAAAFAAGSARADDAAARRELVPTGKLRVAVGVSPAPSAFYTIKDPASGQLRGVTIDLGTELAGKLGVPVEFVTYASSGEIISAMNSGAWDATFMPVDDQRKQVLDFAAPYHLLQSTYLVAPGSAIQSLAEVNRAGVRIAGVANTATFRASSRASTNAVHVEVRGPDEAIELMRAGKADAIALGRESLLGVSAKLPGSRILEGGFLNSTTAAAVPKNKPAALAYVTAFVEEAKSSGRVRRAFDAIGLSNAAVAPAGMKP